MQTPACKSRVGIDDIKRPSSVLAVPLSTRKAGDVSQLVIDLDTTDSPSTEQIDDLDSPARKELQKHLEKLHSILYSFIGSKYKPTIETSVGCDLGLRP